MNRRKCIKFRDKTLEKKLRKKLKEKIAGNSNENRTDKEN